MEGAPAVLQRSKDGGLAVGDAVDGEKWMSWRDTKELRQQDVRTDGTCSGEEGEGKGDWAHSPIGKLCSGIR